MIKNKVENKSQVTCQLLIINFKLLFIKVTSFMEIIISIKYSKTKYEINLPCVFIINKIWIKLKIYMKNTNNRN